MNGNSRKPITPAQGDGNQARASRRALLGAAAAVPPAAVPLAAEGDDAELLRLEQAIVAIGAPAAGDAGRQAKARRLLKWANLDPDGWPMGDDALPWSLARDVLGIAS